MTLFVTLLFRIIPADNQLIVAILVISTIACSCAATAYMYRITTHNKIDEKFKLMEEKETRIINNLETLIEKGQNLILNFEKRLFSTEIETDLLEESSEEVWVLTLDFYWDLSNTKYSSKVEDLLLNKNHRYWWIYPKYLQSQADILKSKLRSKGADEKKVHFSSIEENIASYFPHDIVVYFSKKDIKRDPIILICDVNGKKRDSPQDSLDLPIKDPIITQRYMQLFINLVDSNVPNWMQTS
ncbi:MAG: hypothetical protein KDJ52_29545 [Anaerolineae bacterium]|nr:hypothetical protein [Anaerolineae bacterium]